MLRELAGGRNEVQRRGKIYLTVLVVLQLSDVYLILRRREIDVQGLSRKVKRFSLLCKRPSLLGSYPGDPGFEEETQVGVEKEGRKGEIYALCWGRRKGGAFAWVEGAHEDVNVPHWCWDLLVSFLGTWASLSVTATLGKSRKYLFEGLSSSRLYLL